ncbi:fatty acid desaturase family protein [Sediminitomix flava]|uniref:Linoleoyl-CoA desaturase n=1 Tax=Sediminitomix flava TaxID=379075 RepID=A0A315Z6Z7_SEDFL|nr:acyl-CoA desaturase [Sediminitomix flava]PWJ38535.1 linoleoyl-CoA desaturase [Sediminitomix flava]
MYPTRIKFNRADRPEFVAELKRRVNNYFKENNITKYGNNQMKIKTVFMISLYMSPLVLMLSGVITNVWVMLGMWALMGFGMSGVGLSIMHDANHGSYSNNRKTNDFVSKVLYLVGGYPLNWRIQHNLLHHTYTNIHDHDEDLGQGFIRMSPNQKRKWVHRFQFIYAPLSYTLMTIYWSTSKDFQQVLRYHKKDLLKTQNITLTRALIEIAVSKVVYVLLFVALPIVLLPFAWWQVMLGYILMHAICGLFLALIFQCAHVVEEALFFKVDDENEGSMENNFAIHQMKTTTNFANNSTFFSWFIGGLNYQIEHHLFPNICHIHYKQISKIVKATAEEYDIPYHEKRTFVGALKSHFSILFNLGNGRYDKKHEAPKLQKVAS